MAEIETVRLHITPFNKSLFDAIVPKSVQPVATSVSYHQVQTDPDRGFGYVELPKTEADKLKKKLHGFTLRGFKMKIEEARPEKKRRRSVEDISEERKVSKKVRKEKRKDGEIAGYEMPADRHVKRGWTETGKEAKSGDKKQKREKSKYTKDKEMLFKTGRMTISEGVPTKEDDKSKKRKSRSGPVVVHEFEKTTKYPTFLRNDKSERAGGPLTFVDDQGWVNEEGHLIEAVKQRGRPKTPKAKPVQVDEEMDVDTRSVAVEEQVDSPIGGTATHHEKDIVPNEEEQTEQSPEAESEEISSEDPSSSESESEESEAEVSEPETQAVAAPSPQLAEPADTTIPIKEVHPLEKLYKRRKDNPAMPAPINTSFSFFDNNDNDDDENNAGEDTDMVTDLAAPQTPFTRQDLRSRGLRSAAPTPDTAAIGRKFSFSAPSHHAMPPTLSNLPADEDDNDEDEEDLSSPLAEKAETPKASIAPAPASGSTSVVEVGAPAQREESEFAKTFWAKRGDINRAWKKQRRDAFKGQRQAENRKHSRRDY